MVNAYTALNQLEPVQAMYVNGGYLEELISGYRTLRVDGREPLALDLDKIEITTRDGAKYKRRRIDSRTITIHFSLTADSPAGFASKFNQLKSYLYQIENSQIIFDDEADKYFVGTYKSVKVDYPGRSASVGEIVIECADPFKYSITETTVNATTIDGQKVITTNYQGTYPAHPKIEATCGSDNGFYGFANSNGAVLQIGDPEEVDTEDVQKSEMLINDSFESGIAAGWTVNDGRPTTPEVSTMTGTWETIGSTNKGNGIRAATYGTGTAWHGPGLCKAIPADSHGVVGAKNFKVAWQWEWFTYQRAELSNMQFLVLGNDNGVRYVLAGIELMDGSVGGLASTWRLWVNGTIIQQSSGATNITSGYDNAWAGINCTEPSIQKSGAKITFRIAGQTFAFENAAYTDLAATEITLYTAGNSTYATSTHAAFFYVNFRKDAIDDEEDLPNSFMPNDLIVADTSDATITVNGTDAPELGAITNQWEEFVLTPGSNRIECTPSSWVSNDSYTMKYREVFL